MTGAIIKKRIDPALLTTPFYSLTVVIVTVKLVINNKYALW